MSLQSPLAKAKGLGSAKQGVHHWWMQKVTAVGLIPLVIWFVYSLVLTAKSGETLFDLLASPFHAISLILLLGTSLFHGTLGIQVVIEDYVQCKATKVASLILFKLASTALAVASIIAVIYIHVSGPNQEEKTVTAAPVEVQQYNEQNTNKQ